MAREPELIPVFKDGEDLIIQRSVNGQNVLMYVRVQGACSISKHGVSIRASMMNWGASSYADGRVANQRAAIDRLMARINRAVKIGEKNPGFDAVQEMLDALTGPEPEGIPEQRSEDQPAPAHHQV